MSESYTRHSTSKAAQEIWVGARGLLRWAGLGVVLLTLFMFLPTDRSEACFAAKSAALGAQVAPNIVAWMPAEFAVTKNADLIKASRPGCPPDQDDGTCCPAACCSMCSIGVIAEIPAVKPVQILPTRIFRVQDSPSPREIAPAFPPPRFHL